MSDLEKNVAIRLRAVMSAFGIKTNPALGEICGASSSTVNNWLLGYNLPRVPEMSKLCERTGLTLDWIYCGEVRAVDPKLVIHLASIIEGKSDAA